MSAFLGPVHHWMYGKIQLQEALTDRLLALSKDVSFKEQLAVRFGAVDKRPLEQAIDPQNIHGWLSARVQNAEVRFSEVVTTLLAQEGVGIDAMANAAREMGRAHTVPAGADVSDAYQRLDGVLLDGMPCDGGRQIVGEDADELTFQYDTKLHTLCRNGEAGSAAFAAIREALMGGMLEDAGLTLLPLSEGVYRLKKEG